MFGNLKSGLKQRIKGVVEEIKGRRVDAADPYVPASPAARPTPIGRPAPARMEPPVPVSVVAPAPEKAVASAASEEGVASVGAVAPVEEPVVAPVEEPAPPIEPAPVEELAPVVEAAVEQPAPVVPEPPAAEAVSAEEPAPPAAAAPSVAALAAAAAAGKVAQKVLHADMGSTDLDAYVARAKANGRDVSTLKGGVGLNRAEDGTPYWGPVDNESSRAKAAGKLLTIDQFECISCGTCVEQTDKVYYLPDDGKATPIAQDGPMDLIQDAIDACPVTCIAWVPPEEAEERGLATGAEGGEG